ncbi:ATP-binding cassette sub-family G member 4-like [Octopus sinensis]|uniref:ATP-binding cassette sub-family G member 4-like n=1 Tax=Octopus sinensis TaxID=2607531 RepID=A0A7E6EL45_9MOLL|nr:ATP-binding cassette sub-family G member 4-like [Octopus sinensis]
MRTFKSLSSYIMQHDKLHPNLTVFESMMFAAKLKLPHHISEANKYSRVMDIVESLGLGNCLRVNASKLSGGQRKRLAIAQELISDPAVLFLDEPTRVFKPRQSRQFAAESARVVGKCKSSCQPMQMFGHDRIRLLCNLHRNRNKWNSRNCGLDCSWSS